MPNVTIYIRNEDYEAWNSISNKPKWLHEKLSTKTAITYPVVNLDTRNDTLLVSTDTVYIDEPTYTTIEETL